MKQGIKAGQQKREIKLVFLCINWKSVSQPLAAKQVLSELHPKPVRFLTMDKRL